MRRFIFVFAAALLVPNSFTVDSCEAQEASTVYFLAAGPRHSQSQPHPHAAEYESFVVPGSDPERIATIRALIERADYPVVNVRIRAGGDGINRNFYTPGAPPWNWSVAELVVVQGEPRSVFSPCCPGPGELPEDRYGSVSMIEANPQAWIAKYGDQLNQQWFPLTTEVNPFKDPVPRDPEAPVMANLSSRAITAKGQDIMIGGISISGSRPKQVAVRASGSTLLQRAGLGTRVSPRVRMFGSDGNQLRVFWNIRRYELAARFPGLGDGLGPNTDTLAILRLYPGQYTFHVFDPSGETGLVLFELYDLSLAPQPFP
jgi:hypothetical protein